MKLKLSLLSILFWGATCLSFAQTPAETLEKAVTDYNALRTYVDGLHANTLTDANVADCRIRMEKGLLLLDQVIREGNSDEITAARYFRINFQYQYYFVLGMKGQNSQALEVLKVIEPEFTSLNSGDFPLRYVYTGKNYIIKWENFAPTQAEYYTGYGEVLYNLGNYQESVRISRLALNHPNSSNWLRYISANKLLDSGAKNTSLLTAVERVEYALKSMQLYNALDETEKKTVADHNYPRVKRGLSTLLAEANSGNAAQCAEGAAIASKYEIKSPQVLQLFEAAYRNGFTGTDKAWHKTASEYALSTQFQDRQRSEYVGHTAVDRVAQLTDAADCEGLRAVAAMNAAWSRQQLQAVYQKKAEQCETARERASRKAGRSSYNSYSSGSDFNLYAGVHVLPLLNTNPKRDYGAVLNFVFPKTALEVSYTLINQNKENIFDLWIREVDDADQDNISRWDGFKAHVMPKFIASDGFYTGIMLGYTEKNFETMTLSVTDDLSGIAHSEVFEPAVQQYTLAVQIGTMALAKGFGADFFMGFGATYNVFDDGNDIDREAFTIDNPLLEHRKDEFFGVVLRLGLTVGLNFGRGN